MAAAIAKKAIFSKLLQRIVQDIIMAGRVGSPQETLRPELPRGRSIYPEFEHSGRALRAPSIFKAAHCLRPFHRGPTLGSGHHDRGLRLQRVVRKCSTPRILELSRSSQATATSLFVTAANSMKLDFDGAVLVLSLSVGDIALVGSTSDQRHMSVMFERSEYGRRV
jgi:hypothetical protein